MDDGAFLDHVSDRLAGCREWKRLIWAGRGREGRHRADSDWDFAIYYRAGFDPQALRDVGWPGEVSEIGVWGGGVFNGGAWLTVDGRRVDVHYRVLATIDRELADARERPVLRQVDEFVAEAGPDPDELRGLVDSSRALSAAALDAVV